MAHPKVHVIFTFALALLYLLVVGLFVLAGKDVVIVILVVLFGVLIDADHLSIRRIKKILSGRKGPIEGWINWMHTWQVLAGIIIMTIMFGNILPLISYVVHILIDGGDISNAKCHGVAPLPEWLHQFYPSWLTYHTPLFI